MITDAASKKPLVVWAVRDARPGHLNQVLGLIEALQRRTPCDCYFLPCVPLARLAAAWVTGRFTPAAALPAPDLIIGAGHATHATLLCARRLAGGRSIVLMKPSLPCSWFDLCLIPEHDRPRPLANVIATTGMLNRARPGGTHAANRGLVLVGGPSRHFGWDSRHVFDQISAIVRDTSVHWTIADSRRTPADMRVVLAGLAAANLVYARHEDLPADRLTTELGTAALAWVSADSMSMIFEALTAGARVGLLDTGARGSGRPARAIESLLDRGLVTTFGRHTGGEPLPAPVVLDEAGRCAELLLAPA